jgi:hypothetical protein
VIVLAVIVGLAIVISSSWLLIKSVKKSSGSSKPKMKSRDKIFIGIWLLFFFLGSSLFQVSFKLWAFFMVLILILWEKVISPNMEREKEWECDYCKKTFPYKKECDKHEINCKKKK